MRKFIVSSILVSLIGLGSCELFDSLVPDVDTTISKTFYITIDSPADQEGPQTIDVNDFEDYQDYEENIDGFEINNIKYKITNYVGPDDMYFRGQVKAVSQGMSEVTAGTIEDFLISAYANDGMEHEVEKVVAGIDQIIDWLNDPGNFDLYASYELIDDAGNLYETEGMGYSLNLEIIFDVTVLTGA